MNKFLTIAVVLTFALSSAKPNTEELKNVDRSSGTPLDIGFLSDPEVEFVNFSNSLCVIKAREILSRSRALIKDIEAGKNLGAILKNLEALQSSLSSINCLNEFITTADKVKCAKDASKSQSDLLNQVNNLRGDQDKTLRLVKSMLTVTIVSVTECAGIN